MRRALVGAVALAAAAAGAVPAVAASVTEPIAEPVPNADIATTVQSAPTPLVQARGSMTAVVTVENDGITPLDGATVVLRVTKRPLESRTALAAFLDGGGATMVDAGTAKVGSTVTVPATDGGEPSQVRRLVAGASTTVSVTAPPKSLPFESGTWGVHGVQLALRTADGRSTLMTGAVTWVDASMPTLRLSAVATASGLGARARAVAAATDIAGVTLAVDPTTVSDIGTGTLDLSDRSVVRLPAGDPDLVSLAHSGETSLLDYALARSSGAAVSALHDVPWLAIAADPDRPTGRLAAAEAAGAMLVTGGVDAAPSDDVTRAATVAGTRKGDLALLTPDATLSGMVGNTAVSDGAVGAAIAMGALTASGATSPVLVWTGDDWSPSDSSDATALSALMQAPFVETVDLTRLAADAAGTPVSLPHEHGVAEDLDPSTITGLSERLARLQELSTVAQEPSSILTPGGRSLLSPLARSLRGQSTARELRTVEATASVDATLGALHVAAGSDVNFIADKGSLPVAVVNDLDVDATVQVDMTSFSPNLQVREAPTVTVKAHSTKTVPIEVSAVSSANVQATTVLRNPDGIAIASPVSMSVRVRADWGTAITAVFTGGLVLLLIMGVIRTIRRGRKETRTGPRTPTPTQPPAAEKDE
ncbi:DUF6049 family protein [Demequina soli]|uniref:DUF6049 family protein n=1 Tax=Demequina soli TaxID=1638987 RepID=UPI0007851E01|nr:DUF6049 family protein [Demequina soli]